MTFYCYLICLQQKKRRGSPVGWGTALQAGRSRVRFLMVSLEFFIDIILPAALWPWGWLSLQQKWVPGILPWGVEAAGAQGWQPYHLHVPIVLKSGSLKEPSGPVRTFNGIALPFTRRKALLRFTFPFLLCLFCQLKNRLRFHEIFLSGKGLHRGKSLKNTVLELNHLCRGIWGSVVVKGCGTSRTVPGFFLCSFQ